MNKAVRSAELWLLLSAFIIVGMTVAMAQSVNPAGLPGNDFLRRQADEALEQRLDALDDATPNAQETASPDHQVDPQANTVKGPCFEIKDVGIEGVTLLSAKTLAPVLANYRDRCIQLSDINVLLKSITDLYMDEGYITARVYVPEQDIAGTRELRLIAAEGSLSDIYLNGNPVIGAGIFTTAFPGMKGKSVNMRDVEQGLDQINRLSSNNAKTSMLPGKDPGSSVLNVENKPELPWHFSVSNNNLGQQSTGYSEVARQIWTLR